MNKKELEKELIRFRDDFKEYQKRVSRMWKLAGDGYLKNREAIEKIAKQEIILREELTENLGILESYLKRLGVSMQISAYGRIFPIFDTALSSKIFDNPSKGDALEAAVQMTIKAVGLLKGKDENEINQLTRKTPIIFVAHSFKEENNYLIEKFLKFLQTFDIAISLGSEVNTNSISEKIKKKIDDSDIVLGIMTKDEQNAEGNWSASKWIVEELAYSLGNKDREIIRLIESGCDKEGRIFGDREYIEFHKEDISDALIKLAEVLNKKIEKFSR